MAEQPVYRPETPQDPQRLWIWERHVYLDENKRSWLPIVLKFRGVEDMLLELMESEEY
uniref:T-cell leukemia/lymphoma protein 1A n=1 Tax=Cricetulus griseus TaxID=10029 RepID=A0A8C2LXX4_CRIGR